MVEVLVFWIERVVDVKHLYAAINFKRAGDLDIAEEFSSQSIHRAVEAIAEEGYDPVAPTIAGASAQAAKTAYAITAVGGEAACCRHACAPGNAAAAAIGTQADAADGVTTATFG